MSRPTPLAQRPDLTYVALVPPAPPLPTPHRRAALLAATLLGAPSRAQRPVRPHAPSTMVLERAGRYVTAELESARQGALTVTDEDGHQATYAATLPSSQ